jgi:hypothetical protein
MSELIKTKNPDRGHVLGYACPVYFSTQAYLN